MMRALVGPVLAFALAGAVAAQGPTAPPLDDTRLSVHALVREDLFAGPLYGDMAKFARGKDSVEKLLAKRPEQRAPLIAWRGFAAMAEAVQALEKGRGADYARLHKAAVADLAQARALNPTDGGVNGIAAGTAMILADKLAPADRAPVWEIAYHANQAMWEAQKAGLERFPVHFRGEVMAGLVQSAQRTGRQAEADQHLERMLTMVKGTPYEATALQWKADPKVMAGTSLGCRGCHDPGRLAPSIAALAAKG